MCILYIITQSKAPKPMKRSVALTFIVYHPLLNIPATLEKKYYYV